MQMTTTDMTHVMFAIVNAGAVEAPISGYPRRIAAIQPGSPAEIFDHPFRDLANKPSGPHTYTVVIDPANAHGETNEGNNSNRSEINVPLTYGYWPLGAKPDLQFQDPHYHGPKDGRVIIFHGWFKNPHASQPIGSFRFRILRRGVPITTPVPRDARQARDGAIPLYGIGYTLDSSGRPVVAGLAPGQIREYVVRIEEPEDGDIPYGIIIDSENEIDEEHESGDERSWINNNRANWIVVMNPQGSSG